MLRKLFYNIIKPLLDGISQWLNHLGVTPFQMTVAGLVVNVIGFIFFARGSILAGSLIVLFAGVFDLLDGSLARHSGRASRFGAFIDSVVDRYSDFLIFGGLLIYYARLGQVNWVLLVLAVISGALLTSYTKARAEGLGIRCDVGLVERPERIIIFCLGGIFGAMVPTLWILALTTHVTAMQRIQHAHLQLQESPDISLESAVSTAKEKSNVESET